MSKFWLIVPLLGLVLPLAPAAGKAPTKTPARPAKAGIVGCWERTGEQPGGRWGPSGQTVCFKRNGTIWGVSSDAGDGWDYGGTWRYTGPGKVSVRLSEVEPFACSFWTDLERGFLVISECKGASWNDLWRRDKDMEETIGL